MNVSERWKYKVAIVDAVQLKSLNTDATISIPAFVIQAMQQPEFGDWNEDAWIVQKPDGSVAMYSDGDFRAEFEQ